MASNDTNGANRRTHAIVIASLLAAFALPMSATATSPPMVTFDSLGGNTHWVEARITSSHPINQVLVQVEEQRWHSMSQSSWDPNVYVSGIEIPAGKHVRFQVAIEGWEHMITSCFFSHPDGVERCQYTVPEFQGAFRNPSGNEWWQQIYVDSNRPITAVWVDIDGPTPGTAYLTKRSWGAWAVSAHAPSGSVVRFGMMTEANDFLQSSCYKWPEIVVTACEEPIVFDPRKTTFDHVTGNEWWVEVKLSGPQPDRVIARDTNGAYVPLTLKSWGNWAGSFRIEPGNQVKFRFAAGDALWDSCWFTHPQGLAPDGSQTCGTTFVGQSQPFFTHKGGNEWWVEVAVGHTEPTRVIASDDGFTWVALTKRSWGVWAGSFHIEPGNKVIFRADVVGTTYQSCQFTHPEGFAEGMGPTDKHCNGTTFF